MEKKKGGYLCHRYGGYGIDMAGWMWEEEGQRNKRSNYLEFSFSASDAREPAGNAGRKEKRKFLIVL